MKLITLIILALFSLVVLADARIELGPNGYDNEGDNFYHVPYDSGNTDNELYVPAGVISYAQYDGGNSASAYAEQTAYFPADVLPPGLVYRRPTWVTGDSSGENCTIEANGTQYVTAEWEARVTWTWLDGRSVMKRSIKCLNAAAQ